MEDDMQPPRQHPPRPYEGSGADRAEDAKGARAMGKSLRDYESTARDKREDRAGQRALNQTQQKLTKR